MYEVYQDSTGLASISGNFTSCLVSKASGWVTGWSCNIGGLKPGAAEAGDTGNTGNRGDFTAAPAPTAGFGSVTADELWSALQAGDAPHAWPW